LEEVISTQSTAQALAPSPLSLLEDGLEALDLGLAIFDIDLVLVECNRLFQRIRNYPANLCQPGVALADLLAHDRAHDQLGRNGGDPIDAWLNRAASGQRHATEDALTDGRVIATVMAPMGQGGILLTFADVTEKSVAERELRASKEWQDLVTEASSEGIYDWDVGSNALKVTYRLTAMLGLSPGELTSDDWAERVHPDDYESYRTAIAAHFKGATAYLNCEYRIKRNSGDYIWMSDNGKCVRDADGRAIRLVGAVADITARKLTEASLQKSEERYELAMSAINEGVYDWDITTNKTHYTEGVRQALGFSPDQLATAEDWGSRIHPEDRHAWQQGLLDHFKRKTERFTCEFRFRGPEGEWRWARQHGIAQFDQAGQAVRMIGATGDITELKQQIAETERVKEQLSKAIDSISEGFAIYDSDDRLSVCNDYFRKLYPGIEQMIVPGITHEQILRAAVENNVIAGIEGDPYDWVAERLEGRKNPTGPFDLQLADGRWAKVAWRRTIDGGTVGVLTDITDIKQIEIALRESEERYSIAMDAANEGLWDWDLERGDMYISPKLARDLALSLDKDGRISTDAWQERIYPDDITGYHGAIRSHLRGETEFYSCEFRARAASGDYVWLFHRGLGLRSEDGQVFRMAGSTTDITDRKEVELKVRESEERYALATEAATEGIYEWDLATNGLNVSERLKDIVGVGSLTSDSWAARVHPEDMPTYRTAIVDHMKGVTDYLSCEYRIRREDGDYIWAADNATSVRDENGTVLRLVGAIADVTERRRAEEELRDAKARAESANQMAMEKATTLEALSSQLSKYLSPQIYNSIFTGEQSVEIAAKRKKLTIFFSDIVDFTATADQLESEELTALLNQYLTEMSNIALANGATIDKFIGDAILAFTGDPESKGVAEDALACVHMAIAMQQRMRGLRTEWQAKGLDQAFELRIGINTGYCTVGNFGSEDRMDYTVIGNEVNLASRLESHADVGGIMLSHETWALVRDEIGAEPAGEVALKGIPQPVKAYRVTDSLEAADDENAVREAQRALRRLQADGADSVGAQADAIDALETALARLRDSGNSD
jgi:adenylate cyclase